MIPEIQTVVHALYVWATIKQQIKLNHIIYLSNLPDKIDLIFQG